MCVAQAPPAVWIRNMAEACSDTTPTGIRGKNPLSMLPITSIQEITCSVESTVECQHKRRGHGSAD